MTSLASWHHLSWWRACLLITSSTLADMRRSESASEPVLAAQVRTRATPVRVWSLSASLGGIVRGLARPVLRLPFVQLPSLTDQIIRNNVLQLAGVYKAESLAVFLSLPQERFGSLKERNDQSWGEKETGRPLCELLRTRLEISCPPDPAVPSELSPECPPQTRRGTSAPASWVSPVSPPSARTVRCSPVDYGEFLISSALNRTHLGSGGW